MHVREGDRAKLECLARSRTAEKRAGERIRVILAPAQGMPAGDTVRIRVVGFGDLSPLAEEGS